MDLIIWAAIGVSGLVFIAALIYFAPAKTTVLIDSATATARAEMRVLWGMGPTIHARALPKSSVGSPLKIFSDVVRIGNALMTPGLADAVYDAVRKLFAFNPRVARIHLGVNLGDPTRNLVVQTAAQAAFAAAPAGMRDLVVVSKCEAPGAELLGRFELDASPAQLSSIWAGFRDSRAAREFRKRLKRAPKPTKKPVKEVRAR